MSALLVDLSNNNTLTPNAFPLLKAARVVGLYHKETEGLTFNDKLFALREQAAEHVGIHVGPYHWAHPELHTPAEEAQHFLARYKGHDDPRALKVAFDMEEPKAAHLGRKLIAWSREWNHHVHDALGHWPLFYSNPSFISSVMGMTAADKPIGGGLWLAVYGRNDGQDHPFTVPAPWKCAAAHQFTSSGRMLGIAGSVDLSHATSLRPLLAHPGPAPV